MIFFLVNFDEDGSVSQKLSAMADNLADNFACDTWALLHFAPFAWAHFDAHGCIDIAKILLIGCEPHTVFYMAKI